MFWSLWYGWYRTKELNVCCPIRGNNYEENIKPPNHRLDVYATGMGNPNRRSFEMEMVP
jgi:hypothetical protein